MGVAPRAGAWIETAQFGKLVEAIQRRAPRGRVD